jgi:hypothetical protein
MTYRATVHGVTRATRARVLAGASGLLTTRTSALLAGHHAKWIEP